MLDTSTQSIIKDSTPSIVEEPPLKDRKSCLRRGCGLVFVLVIITAIGLIIIGLFFQKPGATKLAAPPPNFPRNIPLYKFEERAGVNYYPGEKKDRWLERLAANVFNQARWRDLPRLLLAPPSPARQIDTVEIVWQNLDASLKQIENFYRKNLTAEDFTIGVVRREPSRLMLVFNKQAVSGTLEINQPNKNEGGSVVLRVDYKK
jgi:hypothetical protein